ncbi:MAG: hypothetical protein LBV67_04475 [Streptococcaceae bacterium]|jgi:hypothetical protein|nr:hypothetical protein [Streptococcaceae bacterium]
MRIRPKMTINAWEVKPGVIEEIEKEGFYDVAEFVKKQNLTHGDYIIRYLGKSLKVISKEQFEELYMIVGDGDD